MSCVFWLPDQEGRLTEQSDRIVWHQGLRLGQEQSYCNAPIDFRRLFAGV
jgi:hypothetical protein